MCSGNPIRVPLTPAQPRSTAIFSASCRLHVAPEGRSHTAAQLPDHKASPWGITSFISPQIQTVIAYLFPQVPDIARINTLPQASFPNTHVFQRTVSSHPSFLNWISCYGNISRSQPILQNANFLSSFVHFLQWSELWNHTTISRPKP